MSFNLLEFAAKAVAPANASGQDLSEAPENWLEGSPEISERHGGGFRMSGAVPSIGL
jgi:hypothetical protein